MNRLAPTSADNVGIADNHHDICLLNSQPYGRADSLHSFQKSFSANANP
jgi:hypothetical protein